ncbi:hypothetical protein HNP25_004264 [Arcicella rosea]|uniref:Uncharacterized protein n=1 Tax=Arcicella rosea TaxID=502909 RepID=A0A841EZ17_9BACT|nr:hypothetical protein [Arcicella rosea]
MFRGFIVILTFFLIQKLTAATVAKKSRIPNRSGEPPRFAQTVEIRGS